MTLGIPKTASLERARLRLQERLDSEKTAPDRNSKGQFATPPALAHDILNYASQEFAANQEIRFLDPAIGTGAFFSALRTVFPPARVAQASGYEIDSHYGVPAAKLWRETGLDLKIDDFTRAPYPPKEASFDLVVCNPPYVRHHHLESGQKARLRARAMETAGVDIGGLAGLYCYFVALCHQWMAPSALAGWLIPSEFMDVNYGAAVKRYLLGRVTLLHIHRFDPADLQFEDAMVSSAVVWFRNKSPPAEHKIRMTFGGSLTMPKHEAFVSSNELRNAHKWTRFPCGEWNGSTSSPALSEFFRVKRGLATGDNKFFILNEKEISRRGLPMKAFRPILPSPRKLVRDEVDCDSKGNPLLAHRLYLLDSRLPIDRIVRDYPTLWTYLEEGRERGVADRYICRHRTPWYSQESRPAAPLVCTYLGRNGRGRERPVRFILNRSQATAANVYLMLYPTEKIAQAMARDTALTEKAWRALNSIPPEALLGEGRVYGGSLHKLEPKELGNVRSTSLGDLFSGLGVSAGQPDLL